MMNMTHSALDQPPISSLRNTSGNSQSRRSSPQLGGDEFGILVDPVEGGFSHALEVATRLVESVARPYQIAGRTLHVNASCGVAYYPEDGRDPDSLLKHADLAMYAAKRAGGGGVERYRHPGNQ
jgi:diguanylate cyclase (GGDEF)-like protein